MLDSQDNRASLERLREECSLDLLGVADLHGNEELLAAFPHDVRSTLHIAVVIGLRLSRGVLNTLEDGPNLLYLHHYRQINAQLDRAATTISTEIERRGYSALPVPASQIVDWQRMAGQVSHKAMARLAGLGWRGRNNLLVSPQLGAQVRLATVLTDFPLTPDHPLDGNCGRCRRCAEACPAGAIGQTWADFNLKACYEKLDEFRRERRVQQHICGMCVKACPGRVGTAEMDRRGAYG
ncbi:MAG: reductive dehalogenase domain-containing protein [Dehalococcoidia bacterium]|nr:reductive dehalogenase domain-containing protein [Dehalococcoidia bacterium]